ncbi:hypothetical protein N7517_009046 [Penicillium concentricum]|uniref:Uncharacterized protein n=1 Tax=Penicillium concentricum TaxID=293559 RepID=A0A9W9RGN6_9EURO|nr:uncharacterized protein N7517_009046 [Penicillium concentricum]KAJ5359855.1 hypothetical protein N7517_009046 [Penicillium concentricum]
MVRAELNKLNELNKVEHLLAEGPYPNFANNYNGWSKRRQEHKEGQRPPLSIFEEGGQNEPNAFPQLGLGLPTTSHPVERFMESFLADHIRRKSMSRNLRFGSPIPNAHISMTACDASLR